MKEMLMSFFKSLKYYFNLQPPTFVMVADLIPYAYPEHPLGVAVDTIGNVFFSYDYYRVCKVTNSGKALKNFGEPPYISLMGKEEKNDFKNPHSVALDSIGNIYVADTDNHRICKITPDGKTTSLAGSGKSGYADGQGTQACFREPKGLVVDSIGNIYVADTGNHRIRKITPDGNTTTLAGSGKSEFRNGPAKTACFDSPEGIALHKSGDLYVADTNNNRIRMISTSGTVTTLAGSGVFGYLDGRCRNARFGFPTGVAVDSNRNVYISDRANNRIRKIIVNGIFQNPANSYVTTLAGSDKGFRSESGYFNGIGTESSFNNPHGIAVDACGDLYVADSGNNQIRKITNYYTSGVAVDASGNVFVTDTFKNQMRLICSGGKSK